MVITVKENGVYRDGVKIAMLAESPRFHNHYRILTLDGTKIGHVCQPWLRPNWKLEYRSHASYQTLERALKAFFSQ